MVHAAPSRHELVTAYRHLSQLAARAVQRSSPARQTLQTRLRLAFRLSPAADFDAARVRNTCVFLHNAGSYRKSLEARVLKRLAFLWWWDIGGGGLPGTGRRGRDLEILRGWERRRRVMERERVETLRRKWERTGEMAIWEARMDLFRHTLRMLNESMGLCLK